MSGRERDSAAVQSTLIGAMAVWGLSMTAVKALTGFFEPAPWPHRECLLSVR